MPYIMLISNIYNFCMSTKDTGTKKLLRRGLFSWVLLLYFILPPALSSKGTVRILAASHALSSVPELPSGTGILTVDDA